MQLTNILRDVGEDYRMGRIYLPADEMAAHGVATHDLAASKTIGQPAKSPAYSSRAGA